MTPSLRDSLAQVVDEIRRTAKAHEIKADRRDQALDVTEWHAGWDEGATYPADALEAWLKEHGPALLAAVEGKDG